MPWRHRWGSRGTALLVANFHSRWGWVVKAAPRLLYSGETALVSIVQEAGWAPGLVGQMWRREKLFPLPGIEPRAVQPVVSRYTDYVTPAPITINNVGLLYAVCYSWPEDVTQVRLPVRLFF